MGAAAAARGTAVAKAGSSAAVARSVESRVLGYLVAVAAVTEAACSAAQEVEVQEAEWAAVNTFLSSSQSTGDTMPWSSWREKHAR